jgi:hypothetical protein
LPRTTVIFKDGYRFGIAETRDDNRFPPEVEKDFDVAGLGGDLADFLRPLL